MAKNKREPHQMPLRQLVAAIGPTIETKRASGIEPWMITREQAHAYVLRADKRNRFERPISSETTYRLHRRIVESALAAGHLIPAAVLASYPDLRKQHEQS